MKIPSNFLQLDPLNMCNGDTIQLHPSNILYNRTLGKTFVDKFATPYKGHGWYLNKKEDKYFLYISNDSAEVIRVVDYLPNLKRFIEVEFAGVYQGQ